MECPVFYCGSWFRMKKVALEFLSNGEAKARHKGSEPYVVLVGSESHPSCFVEMVLNKNMVGVGFLDDLLREYLTYQFQRVDASRLFLTMATYRKFDGVQDKPVSAETYIFREDGELVMRRKKIGTIEVVETTSRFDPIGNYECVPEFGKYSEVIKLKR